MSETRQDEARELQLMQEQVRVSETRKLASAAKQQLARAKEAAQLSEAKAEERGQRVAQLSGKLGGMQGTEGEEEW